mmetsp:Transcript_16890/g.47141  ORF Transcript_16890/g.47141 Transcript_16890/m.47141 type:complete len:111 (-) Transcript_16890:177-509(-)|eukprot:CAMPEP_0117663688 /NCGR_PEP_ID=MMETSP0804-20121206/8760_1 /TAXON_ID=1074897 /ORGANISM="Tetraselmis astigmatica, Strain CCMP880" /LENGTH=110 /DNA_ID=CAMNT_0005470751 /DNA_START=89 /DNA_END=421 /DNA_ORIENTATION=-
MGSNVSHCEEAEVAEAVPGVIEAPVEVEEEEEAPAEIEVKTTPNDLRFPTTNQARHCYTRYNEFHKCVKEKGEDAEECTFYAKAYRTLCPDEWITKWNEEREAGTFPGKY